MNDSVTSSAESLRYRKAANGADGGNRSNGDYQITDSSTYPTGTAEPGGLSRAQSKLNPHDYSPDANRFPKLSRPVELLRPSYDVVVIGSGYGRGGAASRMARAG